MASVFIDNLKDKIKSKSSNNPSGIPIKNELLDTYTDMVKYNNVLISLVCVVIGSLSFVLMGYSTISKITNTNIYISNLFEVLMSGVAVGIVLWGIKSIFEYSVWKGVLSKNKDEDLFFMFPFFTVEGMSDIAYFIALPIYFLFYLLFSSYFASLVIGCAIFFKFILMYISYEKILPNNASKLDKIILIVTSIIALIFIKFAITLFFL